MARQPGARSALAFAFESTYGTAPASGYSRAPFASTTLGAEQPLVENDLLTGNRDPEAPTLDALNADGTIVVPLDAIMFGNWLKATFGAPATTGSGPYTHTFQTGAWSLPSFAVEKQMPQIPNYSMYAGCAVDTLDWTMERRGNVTASVGVIAQGESKATSTAAGSLASIALTRFAAFNGSVSLDGSAMANVVSASLSYRNNVDRIEVIRSNGKIAGVDPGIAAFTGQIVTRFDSNALIDKAVAGTPVELEFAYTTAGDESLTVTVHEVYLPKPRVAIAGPQGIQATFDWQASLNSAESCMATIVLVNDQASYA